MSLPSASARGGQSAAVHFGSSASSPTGVSVPVSLRIRWCSALAVPFPGKLATLQIGLSQVPRSEWRVAWASRGRYPSPVLAVDLTLTMNEESPAMDQRPWLLAARVKRSFCQGRRRSVRMIV
jgi:hypothetical protein